MARATLLIATTLICAMAYASPAARAQAQSFQDSFAGGSAKPAWQSYPWFEGEPLRGVASEQAPDGDGGIGVLQHQGDGFATVSYAATEPAEDSFRVAAWVYCPYEPEGRDGTLTGLAFYLQTGSAVEEPEEAGFYRLVCDYRFGTGSLSLAYLGPNINRSPLELERWPLIAQSAGAAPEGWRKLEVRVDQGLIELYLDDAQLNDRPIPAERVITDIANIQPGYAGVYAGSLSEEGAAEARIDGFVYEPGWSER